MTKTILRIIGVLVGMGMILPVLAPHIGWVTDWEVASESARLVFSVISGASAGLGLFLIGLLSGLWEWIYNKVS